MGRTGLIRLVLILIIAGASVIYFAALRQNTFGFYHDDGVYVVLAKALATNQGYRIISLPQEPTQTKTPPLYPFLLSLIWRAYPQFPQNVTAMMALSIIVTLSFLALSYGYLVSQGYATSWQALTIIALSSINVYTIIFSTSVLSDMLCAAMSVAGLCLAEKYEKKGRDWATGAILGVVLGLAFLIRSSAITLIIAVAAYYVLRRQWRRALTPVAVAALFVLGWIAWCYFNRTSSGGTNAAYYESYLSTLNDVVGSLKTQDDATGLTVLLRLVGKNVFGLILISVPMVCSGFNYYGLPSLGGFLPVISIIVIILIFCLIAAGFLRHFSCGIRLLHIYIASYLGLHLLWPYATYNRFLISLLPFLLFFLTTEVAALGGSIGRELRSEKKWAERIGAVVLGLILFLLVGVGMYNYGSGIYWSLASMKKIANAASEDALLINWINTHTDLSDVLLCERDPIYYLYTGRKATRLSPLKEGQVVEGGQASVYQYVELIFRIINENNARYLILTRSDSEDEADLNEQSYRTLIRQHPEKFLLVFEPPEGRSVIYRIGN
jgi:hypothetical protein